eukprot:CAMPEP_0113610638 /NCGR_PEP_ID=MMETSP0017_2-20120614/5132_1 /TAXON_ID=2856 /ORGANISM="Cylindrotheca closterium" /LENGTH=457 /DNA_ID=CAMNT_0000519537 /DNA_START=96 /DNA_END=1469 /DNA_ORIENTATION=+ /assembly_acc=CAM_ASM_000147
MIEGECDLGEPLQISEEVRKSYDVSMTFLENKVWDVIVVTDHWGLHDEMANIEDKLVMDALKELGRTVTRASFRDHSFDWHAGRVIVIRTAWAKYWHLDSYKLFLEQVNMHAFLFNPLPLMRWQTNKIGYMSQLSHFVKVPHTIVVPRTVKEVPAYEDVLQELNCTDIIIKPASGNSGLGIRLIPAGATPAEFEEAMETVMWDELIGEDEDDIENDMLVQCFSHSIAHDGIGEINVYIVDGEVTQAGYAVPPEGGYLIHEEWGGWGTDYEASDAEQKFALEVYKAASIITGTKPLYFRVDMMYDNDGELTLMEIACGATDMNFRDDPEGAEDMAAALDEFLQRKEAQYEELHGTKPKLLTQDEYDSKNSAGFRTFGTPVKDGKFGKEKPWLKWNMDRKIPSKEELMNTSEYHKNWYNAVGSGMKPEETWRVVEDLTIQYGEENHAKMDAEKENGQDV